MKFKQLIIFTTTCILYRTDDANYNLRVGSFSKKVLVRVAAHKNAIKPRVPNGEVEIIPS